MLSKAVTGDGKDNDCDGLTDEEFCYSVDTPGLIGKIYLSHDVASGSDITPCNKIDKPLFFYIKIRVTRY